MAATTVPSWSRTGAASAFRPSSYSSTVEEYEIGLNALAAPVRDHHGAVVAAISVAAPSYRLAEADFPQMAARLLEAAEDFGRRLGNSS